MQSRKPPLVERSRPLTGLSTPSHGFEGNIRAMYVPPELRVLRLRPGMVVVEVLGEHDLATRDDTEIGFARLVAENQFVVIDLTETTFIDSSFLHNLLKAQRAAQGQGHTVLLQVGEASIVKHTLEISNALTSFEHVSSREEALAWRGTSSDATEQL